MSREEGKFTGPEQVKSGTLLTSLNYSFTLLVIPLEMAEVETPSCRATSASRREVGGRW